ncbi:MULTISPECIES: urea ABC transporter substrate-binding protein [unclassified Acidiphilium]|uniref:urea ABC transporter substrate-binding protein n=1 Tax=unclassified Acidiphilium TaxID=2617493 RepID=UPI000BCBDFB6|nr:MULTISPECIES: urea ABC transporter substrate-binding protein [unclassified Acidiphilium]OYV55091.1 MAG: urea ABC transporter substrate-binding protein [Acidiphilium sp. 20-67-58]HQT60220.1 urea ABC transporter substrate-binding protein [Acidiphilium sp.]
MRLKKAGLSLLMLAGTALCAPLAHAEPTVKVGVLQSLSGTMAISEVPLENAELLAIDQINAKGGVLGHKIAVIKEDGASEPATFAQKATKLIQQDHVVTVFGGWTSASRKAMLPVFQKFHSLLWYPVQFEGNECSPNIMYSGAQPNQQALPALTWAEQKGYKRYFLLGSDYVYPRTANLILRKHIIHDKLKVVGEQYVPLGGTDFSGVIAKIEQSKPDIIINTLNGDSNVSFFKQLNAAGISTDKLPIMSFSIAEPEAKAMGPSLLAGSFTAWNYYMSLPNQMNQAFIKAYQAKFGKDQVVDDPMVHGYEDVYIWAAAAEKAKSFDPNKVRAAAVKLGFMNSPLGEVKFAQNQSMVQKAYIGELKPDGQFKIVWSSPKEIEPQPYDPLTFPGKSCKLH